MLHPYHLGASLYLPATRHDIWQVISRQNLANVNSIIICLEDAVHANDINDALINLKKVLSIWADSDLEESAVNRPSRPLVFVRPRNPEMLAHLSDWSLIHLVDGYVLPKVDLDSLPKWHWSCQKLATDKLLMPTLETKRIFDQQHNQTLAQTLNHSFQQSVFVLRIGGNDLFSCLRLRRPNNVTLYESPISHIVQQLVTDFVSHDFYLNAPVFEYFDNVDLLKKEVEKDVSCGFVGKTVIHPKQIDIVKQAFFVTASELSQAKAILAPNAKAVFKQDNAMLEPATHTQWAEHILIREEVFGVVD